jgi:hypothetical protein
LKKVRELLDIGELTDLKYELCLGQAYNVIDSLQTTVYMFNAAKGEKKQDVHGTATCTHANVILRNLQDDKYAYAKAYHLTYRALLSIGLLVSSELKPLADDKLWGRDMMAVHQPSDLAKPEPW